MIVKVTDQRITELSLLIKIKRNSFPIDLGISVIIFSIKNECKNVV